MSSAPINDERSALRDLVEGGGDAKDRGDYRDGFPWPNDCARSTPAAAISLNGWGGGALASERGGGEPELDDDHRDEES